MELRDEPAAPPSSDTAQRLAQILAAKAAKKQALSLEFQKQAAEQNRQMFGEQSLNENQSSEPPTNAQGLHPGAEPGLADMFGA